LPGSFSRLYIVETSLMAFRKLRRTDPRSEATLVLPLADDKIGFALSIRAENKHLHKPWNSVDRMGARREKLFKSKCVVVPNTNVVDGHELCGAARGRAATLSFCFVIH